MLSKSLLVLFLTAAVWQLCHGQCHTVPTDLNTQWRGADVLERYARNYYKSLAVGPDDACNRRRRFSSVFSEAMLQYFKSNITDRDEAIRDAVAKTEMELYKPADVIGSEFRATFTYIYSFVDQPLTDIQAVCPYKIREPECIKRFKEIRAERLKVCPGYLWNVELYSTAVFLITNCGFQNLIVELTRESATGCDKEALNFFIETAAVKFSNVLQFLKDIWKGVQALPLTCKTIAFLLLSLCTFLTLWSLYESLCHYDPNDLNSKWRAADITELYGHNYYHSLAIGPDDADDQQKRFVSVFSEAILLYINSDESELESIKFAARKTSERLGQSAEVIASGFRAIMSLIYSIIEQPLTDVQTACPYNLHELHCLKTLHNLQEEKIKKCHHYTKNIHVYDRMAEWSISCGLQTLLEELTIASSRRTESAVDFFVRTATKIVPETYTEYKHIYNMIQRNNFTCNALTFI